ncbi:MAG: helix-turn-helix domain-containing protein [Bacteroidota bacterium]
MPKTSMPQRKKILKLFKEGMDVKEIMDEMNLSYFKVYNVVQGRVKTKYGYRKDKGISRKVAEDEKLSEQVDLENFNDVHDFMEHQIVLVARSMNKTRLSAEERLKMIKDLSSMQKNLQAMKLEKHLQNVDAALIARIMRRFNSTLTDDDIIRIFTEEQQLMTKES